QLFVTFSKNPLLALLTGTLLTMIIQSSSATVGITMTLAGVGLLDFTTAFAVILGDNIGTTITAQLAALNANITAKRTAWAHTLFKVFGAGYMLLLMGIQIKGKPIFLYFVDLVTPGNVWLGENMERHVANTHTIFNVVNCLLFMPLAGLMVVIVTKLVKGEVEVIEHQTMHLDERMLVTPEIAIGQAKNEIIRMGQYAKEQLDFSIKSIFAKNNREREELFEKVKRREETVNLLEREISSFLIRIDQQSITEELATTTAAYLHLIHDIERIGDISENIIDLVILKEEEDIKFSETANKEVRQLSEYVDRAIDLTLNAFVTWDKRLAEEALEIEGKIDATEQAYRDNHISRLGTAECTPKSGIVFLDLLSNLERAGDHSNNIALKTLDLNSLS
ncbi:MAG: Na/Pi symporter, partial [Candidatus Margulisbacteria bacterium]|nr:Na/Pi symporter [Candidatus Margulisiibacteriota bacterium]